MEELKFSSFDIAQMVIEDANERFSPLFSINEERLDIFKQYCSVFDMILKEFGGETLEFSVDEITMRVTAAIGIEELVVDSEDRCAITSLLSKALSFKVEKGEDSALLLTLVFPSLWERSN